MKIAILGVAAALGFLAGCSQNSSPTTAPARIAPQTAPNPADLSSAQWQLIELNGQPVRLAEGQMPPTLKFDTQQHRASGFAGVNRFTGGYAAVGGELKFGPMAGTRMAGPPEAMHLEDTYFEALSRTTNWRIAGQRLELLAGATVVARFEKPMTS